MGFSTRGITSADILAAVTSDSVKWKGADIDQYHTIMDFWSDPINITAPAVAADQALQNVVVPNLSGVSIRAVRALFSCSEVLEMANAAQGLDGAQWIQCDESARGYINAIKFCDQEIAMLALERKVGSFIAVGSYSIWSRVDSMNKTINFKWASMKSNNGDLRLYGVRVGVRLYI